MKHFKNSLGIAAVLISACFAGTSNAMAAQQKFASPDEAVQALQAAAQNNDDAAMRNIFGPEIKKILTGDPVEDAHHRQKFAAVMAEGVKQSREGDTRIILELGTNEWPMPIPLVKTNGQWYFDTAAGEEEIINRHVGKDELHAIGVCRAYVEAQKKFAAMNPGTTNYALHFKSSPGTKDGLYWATTNGEPESPFGPLVAKAHDEGYDQTNGHGPHAFHGYFCRILTKQGEAAPGGKMDYIVDGKLTRGFALVAYPDSYDRSGVMTFIVNQDGKVYQRNFGRKTTVIGRFMKEYNPTSDWTLVEDEGVASAVTEK